MSFALLRDLIHAPSQESWAERNHTALNALFGGPSGRYPKAAAKAVTLRAPEMSADSGVPFAAYIHPSNPSSGPYSGLSFVMFPVAGEPCLIGLVVGTQGLAPDETILGRPGHARKARAICSWLNKRFGVGKFVAWAKDDPTRTDVPVPEDVKREWGAYKSVFDRYGREMYALFRPTEEQGATEAALTAFLDLLFEERGFEPMANSQESSQSIRAEWFEHLMPSVERGQVADLLVVRRYVILQGPPGTGKTMVATELLRETYGGRGRSIQFHPNTSYENFIGGLSPTVSATELGLRFSPLPGFLMEAAAEALRDPTHDYLLHIDEINRADLGKVLGEAIFLLEVTGDRTIELAYDFGEPFHRRFFLPKNLHILGTMNSADRSIAIVDVAVRRRFGFVSLWPRMSVVEQYGGATMRQAFRDLVSIFVEHASDDAFSLVPGHSYFLESNDDRAKQSLRVNLAPLLEEYLAQGYVGASPNRFAVTCNGCEACEASPHRERPRMTPLVAPTVSNEICLELQDHSVTRKSAIEFFQLRRMRDPHAPAARMAEQFVMQNRALLSLLDVRIDREYDGSDVRLVVQAGSAVGAIPLISPTTARPDYGLVVQPRFPWAGIGPMLGAMGWRVSPAPLKLPLLRRSERRVPVWVLASMILTRLRALLDSLDRRFELVEETRRSPRGSVNWTKYATQSLPRGGFLPVPCRFPDLRDDRLLKGAVRYSVEKQIVALESQIEHGPFVHQLIEFAQELLRRVVAVPAYIPSSTTLTAWLQRPMRTEHLSEGLQAIEWTVDERGLAGISDLQGIPWRMPMDRFFEAWAETVFGNVALRTGGRMKVGRKQETTHPLAWDPPYLGSQKSLMPDLWLQWDSTTIIVDAKYKRHWEELQHHSWSRLADELREQHRADLLQVLAYGNLASTPNVITCLVYPCSQASWQSLRERGRLIHRAELTVGVRSLQLWLTAVPMATAVESIAAPLAEAIRTAIRAA